MFCPKPPIGQIPLIPLQDNGILASEMPIRLYQRSPIPAGKDVSVLVLDANSYFSIFLIVGALVLGLFYWGYVRSKDQWETVSPLKNPRKSNRSILFLLLGALVIKLCFAALVMKPHFDYQYFFRWSNEVYQYGFDVYQQSSFLDYPPGYLYILYAIRWLAGLFQLDLTGPVYRTMMETPVILGELLGGWVLYQVARKYRPGNRFWLYFAPTIYLFNPASFLNVNFWGQVDALLASLMMLSFYLVGQNKWIAGALAFTGAVLLKPQALMMTPVYLYFILDCGIASIRERDARPIGRSIPFPDGRYPGTGCSSHREGCFSIGQCLCGVCSGVPSLLRRTRAPLDAGPLL